MGNLDISHSESTKLLNPDTAVTLKLWSKHKDGGWILAGEIKSVEVGIVPKVYKYRKQLFKLQNRQFSDSGELVCAYTQIRATGKCSKCHVKLKAPVSFPPQPFDHWCDRCYANTPLTERIRKCSRAEKRKLTERQEAAAKKKAEERATFLAEQKLKRATRNKPTYTPSRKNKKGDVAFSLALDFTESVVDCESMIEELDCDVLRQQIAEAQDPTIFDEELPDN